MTIASMVGLLTAIFKAVPALKELWDQLLVAYVIHAKNEIKKENKDAIERALKNDDQRSIETQLGSGMAGRPTGLPGTVIVDSLPGMHNETGNKRVHLVE